MATELLRVNELHTHYGDSHVVQGVSLALGEARVMALLGRNGVGKTTTMLTLAGLLRPTGGSIELRGQRTDGLQPERIAALGMRLVPQGRRVFANLTVQENLDVAWRKPEQAGQGWNAERVYALFAPLRSRNRQRAGTLSGGEQQMLVIGRALMGNPHVLLLDEPSEGLAPILVSEVSKAIATLKAEGLSILLVEQNFGIAQALADDFVILSTGKVVWSGTAQEVAANPELALRHLRIQ